MGHRIVQRYVAVRPGIACRRERTVGALDRVTSGNGKIGRIPAAALGHKAAPQAGELATECEVPSACFLPLGADGRSVAGTLMARASRANWLTNDCNGAGWR